MAPIPRNAAPRTVIAVLSTRLGAALRANDGAEGAASRPAR
jgi:hypothetical protein